MINELINFDVRTLIGVLFWGNLTSAALIYSYRAVHKKDYDSASVSILFLSRFLKSIYYLLIFFRGVFPDIISVNLSNCLIFVCHYMEGWLMLSLSKVNLRKPYIIIKIILICSLLLFNFIEFFLHNQELRVTFASLFMFAILVIPVSMLVFTKKNSIFMKIVGLFYILLLVFIFVRAVYSFKIQDTLIFTNNIIQSLTFISFILIMVFSAPAFLLMMKENTEEILEKMATIDSLTNIANRQSFMDKAQICFEEHKIYGNGMVVIFFDIDYFKSVNDNYGHSFGDEVLIKVADIIKHSMRSSDLYCRYGGEEFIALLPKSGEKSGLLVGERVMKEVSELQFEQHPEFKFTISIGIYVDVPSGGDMLPAFINKADMALYEAKNTGRNKIIIYKT